MADDTWDCNLYKNWVRGAKGLEYLHDGLEDFVADKAQVCRDQQLQNITLPTGSLLHCNQCNAQNLLPEHANITKACNRTSCIQSNYRNCFGSRFGGRRKCPNGICSKLYDAIVLDHRYRDPLWKNSDPSTWCSDQMGWSFAKSFETTPGHGMSAGDTDAAGLLSILINSLSMENWLACQNMGSDTACLFHKARDIRNEILHKPNQELDDQTLNEYIDVFIAVLQDPTCLKTYAGSQDAVNNLSKLKSKQIYISERDTADILKMRKEALSELEENQKGAIQEIQASISAGLSTLTKTRVEAEQEILDSKSSGIITITQKRTDAVKEIADTTSTGLSTMNKTRTDAIYEIEERRKAALQDIEDKTSKASAAGIATLDDKEKTILSELEVVKSNIEELKKQQTLIVSPAGEKPLTSIDAHSSTADLGGHTTDADQAYIKLKSQLKADLIEFYRHQHSTLPLSPLLEDEETPPLLEIYVMPEIKVVKLKRSLGGVKEEKTPVAAFRNMFYKENKKCYEIYLLGDAGLGKTAFSKRLALIWCHAKEPITEDDKHFSSEEIDAMSEFDFVFLVILRDGSSECDINDFILNQIVPELTDTSYNLQFLKRVMSQERCLVILDGLDEWIHPLNFCKRGSSSIPHRKARAYTVLTTTRPWKLNVSGIQSSQIEQKLEISGLNLDSAKALKRSVISQLFDEKNENKLQQHLHFFDRTVQENGLSDLETIPILLMYLLCLWGEKIKLGHSRSDIYSNIIEVLLARTVKVYKDIPIASPTKEDIVHCFSKETYCWKFYKLLIALGQLAFQTLLGETREEYTLVFDSALAEKYLNNESLMFCLHTGLLTQNKVQGKLIKRESKVSFAHKTIHEYFAALYIHSYFDSDQTSVPGMLLSKCKCVKDILKVSKILIFLSGMKVNLPASISHQLTKIINEDETTREYRSKLGPCNPLKDFQEVCISCCKELPSESEVNLCIEDVFIDDSCQKEEYRKYLKQLTAGNKQNIISLHIDMDDSDQKVTDYLELGDQENIEKIHLWGIYDDCDILPLLTNSVRCLSLSCSRRCSWSPSLYNKVASLQKLETIHISRFNISSDELTLLLGFISRRNSMCEIELCNLTCADHANSTITECSLNLSKHSDLRKLTLSYIPLSELRINMWSMEECSLHDLSNPDLELQFLNCVPSDSKLHTFWCESLKSAAAIRTILDAIHLFTHVKYMKLWNVNLGDRTLTLSPDMINIERFVLHKVTMPATVLSDLVKEVHKLQAKVTVVMSRCDVRSEEDFEKTKKDLKTLEYFTVIDDRKDWFEFEILGKG